MELSEKLQQLRRARGLSQEQLAEQLQVSRQAVSKWETGEALPETDKLLRLGDYFAVTLDSLLRADQALAARTATGGHAAAPADSAKAAGTPIRVHVAENAAASGGAGLPKNAGLAESAAAPGGAGATDRSCAPQAAGTAAAPCTAAALHPAAADERAQGAALLLRPDALRLIGWALLLLGGCLMAALGNDGAHIWYWPFVRMLPGFAVQVFAVTGFELGMLRLSAADRPAQRLLFWSLALPLIALLPVWLLGCLAATITRSSAFGYLILTAGGVLALTVGANFWYRYLVKTGKKQPVVW